MKPSNSDASWMKLALSEARKSKKKGEVPVGAIAVMDGKEVARAHNLSIQENDPTAHAEILCLRRSATRLKNYRLPDITVYVTKEPCAMCAGAFIWARIKKVVFGCRDEKSGALGSRIDLSQMKGLNHRFKVVRSILEDPCRSILKEFFKEKR